jgi:hypothetical protein
MSGRLPTVAQIEAANAVIAIIAAVALWRFNSTRMAIACLVGAGAMMLNLVAIAGLVRMLLAAGRSGSMGGLAAVATPLKLLFTIGLFYLLVTRAQLDVIGFAVGVATQFAAIVLASGHAILKGAAVEG